MAIGVRETQNIIRQVVVQSRQEVVGHSRLDPQEAGMATGPRYRYRALRRPGVKPDYIQSDTDDFDAWRKLDDDIYKFTQLRKDQFGTLGNPPSYQFLAEVEGQLKHSHGDYELGTFLGLVRLASDLDHTSSTYVTASERGAMHAFWRRIAKPSRPGDLFDPIRVSRFEELLHQGDSTTQRGLADLMRLVSRAARLPLVGAIQEAPALSLSTLLQVVDLAARFNQDSVGRLEFQVSPMDVFLGARSVLFNRSVGNPTLSLLKELVLDESGLYHDDLLEWLQSVGVFGSELTLLMPDSLCAEGYKLPGGRYSALEMVAAGGAKLVKSPALIERTLVTLSDALVYRIQKQDQHKDHQIQNLLQNFNQLLQSERRSAARVSAERKQARYDYMDAIQRASKVAQELQTGQFAALKMEGKTSPSLKGTPDSSETVVKAQLESYSREVLEEWDGLIQEIRRKLTSKSPVFKSLVAQLARIRSVDTCLSHGLTPGGSRCISRLSRLVQDDDLRTRLGFDEKAGQALMGALGTGDPALLSGLESIILAVYGYKGNLENLQFRYRERVDLLPGEISENRSRETRASDTDENAVGIDENNLDEAGLGLILGVLILERQATWLQMGLGPEGDGYQNPTSSNGLIPSGEPYTTYCALLAVHRMKGADPLTQDTASVRQFMQSMGLEERNQFQKMRIDFFNRLGRRISIVPGLQSMALRPGWYLGCERGYMKELRDVVTQAGSELERQVLLHLTEVQTWIDKATVELEADKLALSQQRLRELLG